MDYISQKKDRRSTIAFALIWCVAVFFYPYYSFDFQYWMGLSVMSLFFAYIIAQKLGYLIGAGYAYFAITTIPKIVFPKYFWNQFQIEAIVGLESLVTASYVYVTCITLFFAFFRPSLKAMFITLAGVNSVVILIKVYLGLDPYFLFNNSGTDSGFIASVLPLILTSHFASLFVVACLLVKTSTGIGGVGVACGSYIWAKYPKYKLAIIPLGLALAGAGYLMQGKVLLDSSGRFNIWNMAFEYWKEFGNHWTGVGPGTFYIIMPSLQLVEAVKLGLPGTATFPWLHNGWLQTLLETGYIGLFFFVAIYFRALWHSRRRPDLFAGITTVGAVAIIQMNLNWWMFTCLMAFYIKESRRKEWN